MGSLSCSVWRGRRAMALLAGWMIVVLAFAAAVRADETASDLPVDPNAVVSLEVLAKIHAGLPAAVPDAEASDPAGMKPYVEVIPGTEIKIEMVPIPGGTFVMGSPDDEEGRNDDEGPQHTVVVEPFWMSKYEITWEQYDAWALRLDSQWRQMKRKSQGGEQELWEKLVDAIARPTNAYTDMTFGMGHDGYPAICMTQYAAKFYCKWVTMNTGRYYRLPTEAEWEYACRAGTKTAYSFGDDPGDLDDYGWCFDNSNDSYQKVGKLKPNPWGLYDMHGNVAEWVLDQYVADGYKQFAGKETKNPYVVPTKEYPCVVRGGSWDDDPEALRSAARRGSHPDWKMQDPQIPQSIWYLTDAPFVGFRIIRPLRVPTAEEAKQFEPDPKVLWEYQEAQGHKQ